MSTTVDNKIVNMEFNNKDFEKGVSVTMKSLKNLEASLDTSKWTKEFNLSGIQNGIQSITRLFDPLAGAGVRAFMRIADAAVNAGGRMVKALSVEPIMSGFQEYETQINAIQTILANTQSKGTTLDQVNSALYELNRYADKTIYNFTQMTKNIGTFTAAGVDLDTSVAAIKGIANLAAVSGSTSQQASTAMYQLSQALSAGTVKLQDWNSVVNAGMGGQVFQNALMDTARVHGIAIDEMIKDEGSFRNTLSKGWLSSEILTETLQKFTGDLTKEQLISMGYTNQQADEIIKMGNTANDAATKVKTVTQLIDTLKEAMQSGWTQSWEILVGDFEQAKDLLTSISDVLNDIINKSAESRNNFLTAFANAGGRSMVITTLANAGKGLLSVIELIKESWANVFPKVTTDKIIKIVYAIKQFSSNLILTDSELRDKLEKTLTGFFAILDIGYRILLNAGKYIGGLLVKLKPFADIFLTLTAGIGDFFRILDVSIKKIGFFNTFIGEGWRVAKYAEIAFSSLKDKLHETFGDNKFIMKFVEAFSTLRNVLTGLGERFKKVFSKDSVGSEVITHAGDAVEKTTPIFEKFGEVIDLIKTKIQGAMDAVKGFFGKDTTDTSSMEAAENKINGFSDKISKAFGFIGAAIDDFSENHSLSRVFYGLTVFQGGGFLLLFNKLVNTLTGGFKSVDGMFKSITKITDRIGTGLSSIFTETTNSLKALQSELKAQVLKEIALSIAILAGSLLVLSFIDPGRLTFAMGAVTGLFVDLFGAMSVFEKISGNGNFKSIEKVSRAMIAVSIAVIILSGAMARLSALNLDQLKIGLAGIIYATIDLMGAVVAMDKLGVNIGKGYSAFILLAIAINILSSAVTKLGALDLSAMSQGLFGVGVILGELVAFANNLQVGTAFKPSTAIAIVILASALKILETSVIAFSQMNLSEMTKGLFAVGMALGELGLFINLTKGFNSFKMGTAMGIILLASAIKILETSVMTFSQMDLTSMAQGLFGVGVILGALGIFINKADALSGLKIGGAIGIILLSYAIKNLSDAVLALGSTDFVQLGVGLSAFGLLLYGVAQFVNNLDAGKVLSTVVVVSVVCAAIKVLVSSIVGIGSELNGEQMAVGLLGLLGSVLIFIGSLFAITKMIGEKGLQVQFAIAIFTMLIRSTQVLAEAFKTFADVGLTGIIPALVAIGAVIAILLLGATVADKLIAPMLAMSGAMLAFGGALFLAGLGMSLFSSGLSAIFIMLAAGYEVFLETITDIAKVVIKSAPIIAEAAVTLVLEFGKALLGSIDALLETFFSILEHTAKRFLQSLFVMANDALDLLEEYVGPFTEKGMRILAAFLQGIAEHIGEVTDAAISIIINFTEALANRMPEIIQSGYDLLIAFIDGMTDGMEKNKDRLHESLKKFIKEAIDAGLTIIFGGDKAKEIEDAGKNLLEGLKKGIVKGLDALVKTTDKVGQVAINALKKVFDEHSPSKVTEKIGEFFGVGLQNGINSMIPDVSQSGFDLGEGAIDGLSSSFDGFKMDNYTSDFTGSMNDMTASFDTDPINAQTLAMQEYTEATKEATEAQKDLAETQDTTNKVMSSQVKGRAAATLGEKLMWRGLDALANVTAKMSNAGYSKMLSGYSDWSKRGHTSAETKYTKQYYDLLKEGFFKSGKDNEALQSYINDMKKEDWDALFKMYNDYGHKNGLNTKTAEKFAQKVIDDITQAAESKAKDAEEGNLISLDNKTSRGQLMTSGLSYGAVLQTGNLIGSIAAVIADNNRAGQASDNTGFKWVVDKLDEVGVTLSELNSKVNTFGIVLDSGQLVGALTPGVDAVLGANALLAKRG